MSVIYHHLSLSLFTPRLLQAFDLPLPLTNSPNDQTVVPILLSVKGTEISLGRLLIIISCSCFLFSAISSCLTRSWSSTMSSNSNYKQAFRHEDV
ncbi:hypothetical protein EDC96DRAFT_117218 [Choanephora cucurbitarum]|nr:hypothetical protein EDC96DRAFT_117218 [Choanephora cucurbitarum]